MDKQFRDMTAAELAAYSGPVYSRTAIVPGPIGHTYSDLEAPSVPLLDALCNELKKAQPRTKFSDVKTRLTA